MLTEEQIIKDYEQVMTENGGIARRKNGVTRDSYEIMFKKSDFESKKELAILLRYIVRDMLKWTPEEFMVNVDGELLKFLHLDVALRRAHINSDDLCSLFKEAFPETVSFNDDKMTVMVYKQVAMLEEYANKPPTHGFKKNFFSHEDGVRRLRAIIYYLDETYLSALAPQERYAFFSDVQRGRKWFEHMSLSLALSVISSDPLVLYHRAHQGIARHDFYFYNELLRRRMDEAPLAAV